jgi:hypothetical protein
MVLALIAGLGEEPGWRGFALPRLETRLAPLLATALLGFVWAMWHLPLVFVDPRFPHGFTSIAPQILLALLTMLTIFFYTWVYNRTQSVLLCMLLHGSFNAAIGLLPASFEVLQGGHTWRSWSCRWQPSSLPWQFSLSQPVVGSVMLLPRGVPLPIDWRDSVVSTIRHQFQSRSGISERIVGEPLEIGARTIRPVVRVSGWRGTGDDASAGRAGVQLRVGPAGVIVLERDGREHRIPTPDDTSRILWGMAGVALMIAVASRVVVRILG